MRLTFLAGHIGDRRIPLTKTFERDAEGGITKHSYPRVHRFTSFTEEVDTLRAFAAALREHARQFHCLLKGNVTRDLAAESRAGSTESGEPTDWLCLDIDGLPGITRPQDLLNEIPGFAGTHHVIQYSASQGVDPDKGLSAHAFVQLAESCTPQHLKEWLRHLNFTIPLLRENIRLSRTGTVLTYPLDITTCQNDKLIYIAPPITRGCIDQFKGQRIKYVRGRHQRRFTPNFEDVNPESNRAEAQRLLNELRRERGLEPKRFTTKVVRGVEVMGGSPGPAQVTGVKEERGFVYLNLNGGDSWGYYFPADNPEILYNFKGEPNYQLKDLAPGFYTERKKEVDERVAAERREVSLQGSQDELSGHRFLAFRDKRSDTYYVGYYDESTDNLDFHRVDSQTKIFHYFREHEQPLPDFIPTWNYEFRFDDPKLIDFDRKFVNRYNPPPLMRIAPRKGARVPPLIWRILDHALCHDRKVIEHFLNWVACIYQHRMKTKTAWLLQGTEGTGKGLIYDRILSPIFGREYAFAASINSLEDQFNQYLESNVLLFVDESDIKNSLNSSKVMSRLREYVTEPTLTVRGMRQNPYKALNYTNVIVATNRPVGVMLTHEDRRFNVAGRQNVKLSLTEAEYHEQIDDELPAFAEYLATREVDTLKVRTPINTEARDHLIQTSISSNDAVAEAILSGDLEFFAEALPTDKVLADLDQFTALRQSAFTMVLKEAAEAADKGETHRLSRDQMHALFRFCVDRVPDTPKKFTYFLKHHRIFLERLRKDGANVYGISVDWHGDKDTLAIALGEQPKLRRVK